MDLMDKFKAVEVETDRRITRADKAFCEKHQAAYEAAMEAFHEFSFFWADMVEAQHELLQEKENYKNKEYLDTSVGVKVDEDRIRENIECLHSKLIRSLVSHFKSTYKVSIDYYDIEQHILPQKPSCYAGEEERRAYHEKMDTMVIQYRDVVDLIILQLGGRSFSEQAEYEIKEAARNAVWDWHSKSATFAVKKSTITLTGYFCSYEADFDRWSLSSNMIKVLYALAYYETGTAGILPRRTTDLIEDYRQYCDVIELEGCEKATKLRMFKNGRVDITFASPDCARCFAKDYFGEQWESAA